MGRATPCPTTQSLFAIRHSHLYTRARSRSGAPGPHSLVEAGGVGVLVLLDDGHYEGDQLGPEIQVLDAGALLLGGHLPLLGLEGTWRHGSEGSRAGAQSAHCRRQRWGRRGPGEGGWLGRACLARNRTHKNWPQRAPATTALGRSRLSDATQKTEGKGFH